MRRPSTLVPAALGHYARVFGQEAPYLAASLPRDIDALTAPLRDSGHLAQAWQSSTLGYNRAPVEFTANTYQPQALSCTIDPFVKAPGLPMGMDAFLPHYQKVDKHGAMADFGKAIASQADATLRFGAWLGLKYSPQGEWAKVYAEVPDSPAGLAPYFAQAGTYHARLKAAGLTLLMVGFYPEKAGHIEEYYYQWHSARIADGDVAKAMAFLGCADWYPRLAALLAQARQCAGCAQGYHPTTYGFSLSLGPCGQPTAFSLFAMAPAFWGGNEQAYQGMRALMQARGWAMPLYTAVAAAGLWAQHNVVGFSVTDKSEGMHATFSPSMAEFAEVPAPSIHVNHAHGQVAAAFKKHQLPNGAIAAQVRLPGNAWRSDANAFVTAQTLRLVAGQPSLAGPTAKALDFLESCRARPGQFSFWPDDAHPAWMGTERIDPDIDDTAVATEVLYQYGRADSGDLSAALAAMAACQVDRVARAAHPWARCHAYHTWMRHDNDLAQLDCCANTNALALLHTAGRQDTPAYHAILRMLADAWAWADNRYDRLMRLMPYYAHPAEWAEALAYATQLGIVPLAPIAEALNDKWGLAAAVGPLPLYQRHDGRFTWFSTGLSAMRQTILSNSKNTTHGQYTNRRRGKALPHHTP